MANSEKSVRKPLSGMQSISNETVKFESLLDRPIIIVERERRNGQFGEYDQWLVDTGDTLVYTTLGNKYQRVAAEYRRWLSEHPGQLCPCVITAIPDEKTGYARYRWEEWTDDDQKVFLQAKEHAAKLAEQDDEVPF